MNFITKLEEETYSFEPFNGTTKEEYVSWVKNWKSEYKKLSEHIRFMKHRRKTSIYGDEIGDYATYRCRVFKEYANEALEFRKESKVQAQKNYEEKETRGCLIA